MCPFCNIPDGRKADITLLTTINVNPDGDILEITPQFITIPEPLPSTSEPIKERESNVGDLEAMPMELLLTSSKTSIPSLLFVS
jgi:hypothetical protein